MLQLREKLKGVEGLSHPFKEFIIEQELEEGAQIVYYGRPALCVPYIMVKSYAIRGKAPNIAYIKKLNTSVTLQV